MPSVDLYLSVSLVDRFLSLGLARDLLLRTYVLHSLEDIRSSTYQPSLFRSDNPTWRVYILQFRPGVYAGTESVPTLSPRSVFERQRARVLALALTQLTEVDQHLFSACRDYTAWRVASA